MPVDKLFFTAELADTVRSLKRLNKLKLIVDIVNDLEKQLAVNAVNIEIFRADIDIQITFFLHIGFIERVNARHNLKIYPFACRIAVRRPQTQLTKHTLEFQLDPAV